MEEKISLGNIDKKILYELSEDGRQPISKIAKKLRISPQLANYHFSTMQKNGVFRKFLTVVDYKKLGYTYHTVFYALSRMTIGVSDKIREFLFSNPNIMSTYRYDGAWDISMGVLVRDASYFREVLDEIRNNFHDVIGDHGMITHVGAHHFGWRYLLSSKEGIRTLKKCPATGGRYRKIVSIDDNEERILRILSDDARTPTTLIAKKVGISPESVSRKIRHLKDSGIIVGFTIVPNYRLHPYISSRLLLDFRYMSREQLDDFCRYTGQLPSCVRLIHTFGRYDMVVNLMAKDEEDLRNTLFGMRERFGDMIKRQDMLRVYDVDKYQLYPSEPLKQSR